MMFKIARVGRFASEVALAWRKDFVLIPRWEAEGRAGPEPDLFVLAPAVANRARAW
jgi:hypothetical protein